MIVICKKVDLMTFVYTENCFWMNAYLMKLLLLDRVLFPFYLDTPMCISIHNKIQVKERKFSKKAWKIVDKIQSSSRNVSTLLPGGVDLCCIDVERSRRSG